LWLDAPESRLRCPCHSTSFSLQGTNVTHQLPVAPRPLPRFRVREINGVIEIFAPTKPA
jgi:Rieske Fe-S protein